MGNIFSLLWDESINPNESFGKVAKVAGSVGTQLDLNKLKSFLNSAINLILSAFSCSRKSAIHFFKSSASSFSFSSSGLGALTQWETNEDIELGFWGGGHLKWSNQWDTRESGCWLIFCSSCSFNYFVIFFTFKLL